MGHASLQIRFEAERTQCPANPRYPEATERDISAGPTVRVDPDRAGLELSCNLLRASDIAAPDRGSQTIAGGVGTPHSLVNRLESQHRQHRSELLFINESRSFRDPGDNRRRNEETRPWQCSTPCYKPGSALPRVLKDCQHLLILRLVL